ncbi:hypothetical protein [Lentzea sp. NPDC092896]|uniref:hypothetical protein n=1 Tax=Lentzea sp. NPDC092896 TaxID=3364127 RepID=UPI003803D23C
MGAKAKLIAHPWITLFIAAIAVSAWAGVAGLGTGTVELGPVVTARLPFHSSTVAATALSLVVALPMSLAAWLCGANRPQWRFAAAGAGALLVGWILVQVTIIRTFSWLQPVMALAGLAVLVCAATGTKVLTRKRLS